MTRTWKAYGRTVYEDETRIALVYSNFEREQWGEGEGNDLTDEEAYENAKLIAVAPELLESLIDCVDVIGDYEAEAESYGGARKKALEIIAKVKRR